MATKKSVNKPIWIYIIIALVSFIISFFVSITEQVNKIELSIRDAFLRLEDLFRWNIHQ